MLEKTNQKKAYSKIDAYSGLPETRYNCKKHSTKAPDPEIQRSRNEPPKARGQINAESVNAKMHLRRLLYIGFFFKSLFSSAVASFALLSSCTTPRYISYTSCKFPSQILLALLIQWVSDVWVSSSWKQQTTIPGS